MHQQKGISVWTLWPSVRTQLCVCSVCRARNHPARFFVRLVASDARHFCTFQRGRNIASRQGLKLSRPRDCLLGVLLLRLPVLSSILRLLSAFPFIGVLLWARLATPLPSVGAQFCVAPALSSPRRTPSFFPGALPRTAPSLSFVLHWLSPRCAGAPFCASPAISFTLRRRTPAR